MGVFLSKSCFGCSIYSFFLNRSNFVDISRRHGLPACRVHSSNDKSSSLCFNVQVVLALQTSFGNLPPPILPARKTLFFISVSAYLNIELPPEPCLHKNTDAFFNG